MIEPNSRGDSRSETLATDGSGRQVQQEKAITDQRVVESPAPENGLFQIFSTQVKGDLLVLFHKNPGLIDTFDGVARRIGRTAKEIQGDVMDLVSIGILKTRKLRSHEIVAFDRSKDSQIQEAILSYLKNVRV